MLRALMSKYTFCWLSLASACVMVLGSCTGDVGTTCFQDDECNEGLICCHVGSPFTQGTCQTEEICADMGGGMGGAGGDGGSGGFSGAGGAAGAGGQAGSAGRGGGSGAGGQGATAGSGGATGNGGTSGAGGSGGA